MLQNANIIYKCICIKFENWHIMFCFVLADECYRPAVRYSGHVTIPNCLDWFDVQMYMYNTTLLDLDHFPDASWETLGSKCRWVNIGIIIYIKKLLMDSNLEMIQRITLFSKVTFLKHLSVFLRP